MAKRGKRLAITIYFILLMWLNAIFIIHAFGFYDLETGFFSRYVLAMIFVLMILPLVPKIKIFDIVDIKRETRMFSKKK